MLGRASGSAACLGEIGNQRHAQPLRQGSGAYQNDVADRQLLRDDPEVEELVGQRLLVGEDVFVERLDGAEVGALAGQRDLLDVDRDAGDLRDIADGGRVEIGLRRRADLAPARR